MKSIELETALCAYISEALLAGLKISADQDLLLSDLLDSLGVVRLIGHIEESCGIAIPPEDIVFETMQSVDAMAAYLRSAHGVTELCLETA